MAKAGDVWELHGITSWGVACDDRDLPGVYAAVHCEHTYAHALSRTHICILPLTCVYP